MCFCFGRFVVLIGFALRNAKPQKQRTMTILLSIFGFVFIYAAIDVAKINTECEKDIIVNRFIVWLLATLGAGCFYLLGYISQSY